MAANGMVDTNRWPDWGVIPILDHYLRTNDLRYIQQDTPKVIQSLYSEWHPIVQSYSRGNPTKGLDKLPALFGVAEVFH